jgi:outer membrane receptor protein involved in Fe transport
MRSHVYLGACAVFSTLALVMPAVASAQAAPDAVKTAAAAPADDGATIIVTGTRINRPNLTSAVPVTSITAVELTQSSGNVSIGDTLNELPQLRATRTQANSTRFIGTAGITALDLRGLGTARTLTLVDGRRLITATPGSIVPDINDIPTDLIERVDIVTGGNSAIYGSDAVAGVVNFILKQNFEGFSGRAQSGISSRGDRGTYFVDLTAGHNFADGRGNVSVSAEFVHEDTLTNLQRDNQTGALSGQNGFTNVENTGANLNPSAGALHPIQPSTGNGIPDRAFLRNLTFNSISEGGLFTASCPVVAATGESAAAFAARRLVACTGIPNPASSNALAQFGNLFVFNRDGTLIKNPLITDLRPFGSSFSVGGRSSTLRLTGFLTPGIERKSFNFLTHYEISPAFVPYIQARYVHVTANQQGQPTFFNNAFDINNPFLTAQAKTLLQSVLAPGQTSFTAQRFNIDFGGRGELHTRDNYTALAGVRGTFFDDWKYDASVNYSHLYTYYQTQGNVLRPQYANSINATTNAAGQIVCAINAVTVTDPACVPVNLFGDSQPSKAALNYFGYTSSRKQKADLLDATVSVSGDSSKLFSMPGGPVAFAIGAEYRRETAYAAYDKVTSNPAGLTFLNVIPDFRPPASIVKEGFLEVNVPLIKDKPLIQELTVDGAVRVSNYNIGNTGTVYTYNGNLVYAPVRDIKFRAGYARAIRAPTQSDLYGSQSQTFLNGLVDPCGQQNINNGPNTNRIANCAAAGVPTTQTFSVGGVTSTEPFSNRPNSGISGFNGGNPKLSAEKSDSVTIGAIVQPRFIPGLALTVDYYHINIKNVIVSVAPQTIINQCYDSTTGINNPFCAVVFRNPNGTFKGQSDVQHAGGVVSLTRTGPSFVSTPFNYARNVTSGIDVDLSYRVDVGNGVGVNLRAIATHTFVKNNFNNITDPKFAIRQLGVLGDPEWQGQVSANVTKGIFNVGYRMRLIGRTVVSGAYETQNSFQGRPPQNPDAYPFTWYPTVTYHDLRVDIAPKKLPFSMYLGVDNIFDQLPPYDLLGTEGGNPYNPTGRAFYVGVKVRY